MEPALAIVDSCQDIFRASTRTYSIRCGLRMALIAIIPRRSWRMHKIALAVARGTNAGKTRARDPSGESAPRAYLFDEAFFPSWDESILNGTTDSSRMVPSWWRLAREIQRLHAEYDAIVTWG